MVRKAGKKTDDTYRQRVLVRQIGLKCLSQERPVVLETQGGDGRLYRACYVSVVDGVVFEKHEAQAGFLARQRPTWAVYEGDCVEAIRAGVGDHLACNLLDVNSDGDPWPAIGAFFESERPRPARMGVVVNDVLRRKLKRGRAWTIEALQEMVERFGNDLYGVYLAVCEELMQQKAAQAGYRVSRFAGYYCGRGEQATHFIALLSK